MTKQIEQRIEYRICRLALGEKCNGPKDWDRCWNYCMEEGLNCDYAETREV